MKTHFRGNIKPVCNEGRLFVAWNFIKKNRLLSCDKETNILNHLLTKFIENNNVSERIDDDVPRLAT